MYRLQAAVMFMAITGYVRTAWCALSASQVVVNINQVATVSSSANTALVPLSVVPSVSQLQSISVNLVNSFTTIVTSLSNDVSAMASTQAFSDVDATPIVNALNNFIAVHQTLLGTVIGKHSIFAQFILTAEIATVLLSLETGIDSFAKALIELIPTRMTTVNISIGQLDQTVASAISTYQAVCVPSAVYPAIPPTCVSL